MADSMEKKILAALKTKLEELTFVNQVDYDRIRATVSDFQPNEIPGIQIFDNGQIFTHQRMLVDVEWNIIVEFFQAANPDGSHDAATLYDRKFEIERKIGDNVRLSIPAVSDDGAIFHVKYTQANTNLFLVNGMSIAQLGFQILFKKPYTDPC